MKQQKLPIKLKIKYLALKILIPVVVIIASSVVVFYFLFISAKDQMLEYFPKETQLYVSLKVDEAFSNNIFYQRLGFDDELKRDISLVLSEYIKLDVNRNISFGLIPLNGKLEPLYIVRLKKELPPNNSVFGHLQRLNFKSFKINNPILNRHYIAVSRSQEVMEMVKRRIAKKTAGLSSKLNVSFRMNSLIDEPGSLIIDSSLIKKIIPEKFSTYIKDLIPDNKNIIMKIEQNDGMLVLRNGDLSGNIPFEQYNINDTQFGFRSILPMSKLDSYILSNVSNEDMKKLERQFGLSYENDIKTLPVKSLDYINFSEDKSIIKFDITKKGDTNKVLDKISDILIEYLAVKNSGNQVEILPDGSKIIKYAKNREGLVFSDRDDTIGISSMYDSINNDDYYRYIDKHSVIFTKNIIPSEVKTETLNGCLVDGTYENVIIGNEYIASIPILGDISQRMVFVTYPQSYPQFLLCIQ